MRCSLSSTMNSKTFLSPGTNACHVCRIIRTNNILPINTIISNCQWWLSTCYSIATLNIWAYFPIFIIKRILFNLILTLINTDCMIIVVITIVAMTRLTASIIFTFNETWTNIVIHTIVIIGVILRISLFKTNIFIKNFHTLVLIKILFVLKILT